MLKRRKEGIWTSELAPGIKAPAFTLKRDGGGTVSLKDFKGRKLVLYFYPKADTPGCTREAIDFSRLQGAIRQGRHRNSRRFRRPGRRRRTVSRRKHKIKLALASATRRTRCSRPMAPGAKKSMYGRNFMGVIRKTFLIDANGRIAQVWPKVRVDGPCRGGARGGQGAC